jgi:hypothetical protein
MRYRSRARAAWLLAIPAAAALLVHRADQARGQMGRARDRDRLELCGVYLRPVRWPRRVVRP